MKKLYLLAIALMAGSAVFAQSTRTILAEEFTQASCGPCASQNPAFNTLLQANEANVIPLKYQTSWPGVDPMNAQTQTWVGPRVTFYGVSGVPTACLDGVQLTGANYTGAPSNWSQGAINAEAVISSPFSMSLSHSINATYDSISINCEVTCTQAISGNMVLHIAVVEKTISFLTAPGSNGETEFYYVMRQMYPTASGTTIAANWTNGQSQTFTFNQKIPTYIYDRREMAVVAFIQDNTTKEVHQAAISQPLPVTMDASILPTSTVPPVFTCTAPYTASFDLTNKNSTDPLTSVDFSYTLTGGIAGTQSWTGNLAPGASTTVTFPTLNLSSGNNVFAATITAINGVVDQNPGNNVYTQKASAALYAVHTPPVSADFVATTWPPADWIVGNMDGGYTWTRSTSPSTPATNRGSAKMDFFNSSTGQIDWLYLPKVDLSGAQSSTMTFSISDARYSASYSDRLEVVASTDCGQTWTSLWSKAGAALATVANTTSAYTPTAAYNAAQWRAESVNFSTLIGQPDVLVAFKATSAYGNNCYVDDVNMTVTVGVGENQQEQTISMFPIPSKGEVYIDLSSVKSSTVTLNVTDAAGRSLMTRQAVKSGNEVSVDLSSFSSGTYFVNVTADGKVTTHRIILDK